MIKLFVATKAFIRYQDKILILRESGNYADGSNVGRYDVVGGRITPGETFSDSLLREVFEETGLKITIGKPFFVSERRPIVKDEQRQVVGIFFECISNTDKVVLSEDHNHYERIDSINYKQYNIINNLKNAFEEYIKCR